MFKQLSVRGYKDGCRTLGKSLGETLKTAFRKPLPTCSQGLEEGFSELLKMILLFVPLLFSFT